MPRKLVVLGLLAVAAGGTVSVLWESRAPFGAADPRAGTTRAGQMAIASGYRALALRPATPAVPAPVQW